MVTVLFLLSTAMSQSDSTCRTTESPVIGILVQDYLGDFKSYRLNRTFIAATYVKFIESSGGRVVPIHTDQSMTYYDRILNQVNGVLLPGGDQDTVNSSYTRTTSIVYRHAVESNKRGVYYPVWGVCQGLEVLAYLTTGEDPLHPCSANDYATPLRFTMDLKNLNVKTKLFQKLTFSEYNEVVSNAVAFQWHNLCLLKQTYYRSPSLREAFQILGTNHDRDGNEYVSMMESNKYPFFGIMFHPEEVMFSFQVKENHTSVPHTNHALHAAQYFANFFTDESRKNPNQMSDTILQKLIIYNHVPEHTTDSHEPYDLCYFFELFDFSSLFTDDYDPNPDIILPV